jgi:recombination protein RecA
MARKKQVVEIGGQAWEAAYKSIMSEYKEAFIGSVDELEEYPFISTGSIGLDYNLGGGIEMGRVVEIFGPPYSGKSSTAYSIIAQYQKREDAKRVVYADAERSLDTKFVKSFGVDTSPDKFVVVRAYDGESNIDILENLVKSGEVGMFVVDSVTGLIPPPEAEGTIKTDHMGAHAKLMSRALLRLNPLINITGCMGIFINQQRQKVGFVMGDPNITTGGYALLYYASYRIKVTGGAKSTRIISKDGIPIGHKMTFLIEKNKTAPPFRTYDLNLIYGKGFDVYSEVFDWAVDLGIIDKKGAWYEYEGSKYQGKDPILDSLRESDYLYNELKDKVKNIIGKAPMNEEIDDELFEAPTEEQPATE